MILVENLLRLRNIGGDTGLLAPGERDQRIEIRADHGRFCGHRAHLTELIQFLKRLILRFRAHPGGFDLLLVVVRHVVPVIPLPEFLLNGLHLLIQIVVSLVLLHLLLHTAVNPLLHLLDFGFAAKEAEEFGKRAVQVIRLEQLLLRGHRDRELLHHDIGEPRSVCRLVDTAREILRNLRIQLRVGRERLDGRAAQRFRFRRIRFLHRARRHRGREIPVHFTHRAHIDAFLAFDQNLHRLIRESQHLKNGAHAADLKQILSGRFIDLAVPLGDKKDLLTLVHRNFRSPDRFRPAHEKGDHHTREHHDVTQRKEREHFKSGVLRFFCHSIRSKKCETARQKTIFRPGVSRLTAVLKPYMGAVNAVSRVFEKRKRRSRTFRVPPQL